MPGDQPVIKEITVHYGGGGKVQLEQYVQGSEYGCNISRTYVAPSSWDDNQVAVFELETVEALKEQLEPILQGEHDSRMAAREAISSS
jgi:hypothetical protein